jgi:NitT/TauT family transport system substrate-binding protein
MQKTKLVLMTALLAMVVAACGSDADGGDGTTSITVASIPNVKAAGLYIAQEEGIFEEEGLSVDIVETEAGQDAVAAVVSGSAQFVDAELEDMITLTESGDDSLIMMHNVLNRVTLTLVMRRELAEELGVSRDSPLDERLAALEGLTLGITSPGATTDDFMQYYLRRAGLQPDRDAEIVAMGGGASLLAALETGQIDAYHLSPPTPFIAESEGFGTVLINGPEGDVPEFADFIYTAWAVNRDWADDNAEATQAFSRAIARGVARAHEDPETGAQITADFLGASLDETEESLQAMLPAMPESGCLGEVEMGESLSTLFDAEITSVEGDPTEGVLWTNEHAEGC